MIGSPTDDRVPRPGLLPSSGHPEPPGSGGDRKEARLRPRRHHTTGGRPSCGDDGAKKPPVPAIEQHRRAERSSGTPHCLCCQEEVSIMRPGPQKVPLDISPQVFRKNTGMWSATCDAQTCCRSTPFTRNSTAKDVPSRITESVKATFNSNSKPI